MTDKNYHYKKELKEKVLTKINELNPKEQLKNNHHKDCPSCYKEDMFVYYPAFKYGICNECSYEEGFEYYSTVFGNQLEDFEEIYFKIEKLLKSW